MPDPPRPRSLGGFFMPYPASGVGSAHTARREPWLVSLGPACNGIEGQAPPHEKTPARGDGQGKNTMHHQQARGGD
jgi:hypothetical protein